MHLSNERLGRGSVGASPEQRTGHQIDEADAAFVFVDQVVTGTVVEAIVEREAKGRVVTGRVLDRHRWDSIRSVDVERDCSSAARWRKPPRPRRAGARFPAPTARLTSAT
jgi:hypothetical protein